MTSSIRKPGAPPEIQDRYISSLKEQNRIMQTEIRYLISVSISVSIKYLISTWM
jgi:hypothetical protein